MSTLLSRSAPLSADELDPQLAGDNAPKRRNRVAEWLRNHSATLYWLSPIVVLAGLLNAINLAGSPAHGYGEASIAMRAWSVTHLGQLTPYTYTYDQPPFGWLQIAGWTGLTGGFSRYSLAVDAAREAMVVAAIIGVVLLWFLARRLGFGRAASGVATIVFALSPLAVDLHRTVFLDNVAMVWILAALLLATSRRWQLLGFTSSAVALGIAILSSETAALALPLVALVMWRTAYKENRRYTLSIAGAVIVLACAAFVVFAFIRGQLFPSAVHPSLMGGIASQFAGSAGGTSLGGAISASLTQWRELDPVLFFLTPVAALGGLLIRRVRALAVALLALIVIAVISIGANTEESLQGPIVILALPVAALVIASLVDYAIRLVRFRRFPTRIRFAAGAAAVVVAIAALAPTWTPQLSGQLVANRVQPETSQAERWILANVPKDSRLIVDNSIWVSLVTSGFAQNNVISFSKLDTDSAVKAQSPQGWKDSDYVVSTDQMRRSSDARAARSAIASSVLVASFGRGTQNIQVRRIVPAGASQVTTEQTGALAQRTALGSEIADNPMLRVDAADIARLRSGRVDPRIPLLIGQLAANGVVSVSRLPVVAGEAGLPIREVVLASVNGQQLTSNGTLTAAGRSIVNSLAGSFAAQSGTAASDGLLITFSITLPTGIIQ